MIEIVAISSPEEYKAFVEFPFSLYKNHPYWVPPIKAEELETINKDINPVFNNATARFFLAYKNGKIAGRIAAMINLLLSPTLTMVSDLLEFTPTIPPTFETP